MNARSLPPEWTDSTVKHGVDPLGMQNASVSKYQDLVPGISNVTLRMRYYGLYAWLSDRYARQVGVGNIETWKWHVRRAELLYALVAQKKTGERGVAGTNWAHVALNQPTGTVDFAAGADPMAPNPYLRQEWGAYGGAYYSQLVATGVLTKADGHPVPVPSEASGDRLARIFGDARAELGETFFDVLTRGSVTHEELTRLAPLAPSAIPPDSQERAAYEDLLFCRMANTPTGDQNRKMTLTLLLQLANQMGSCPTSTDVRWSLYTGQLVDGRPLQLHDPALRAHRDRWWLYQLDDLCHMCLESLLKFTLDILEGYPIGLSMRELIAEATQRIADERQAPADSWAQFTTGTASAVGWGSSSEPATEYHRLERLLRSARPNASVQAGDALNSLELLAVLSQRAKADSAGFVSHTTKSDNDGARSIHTEMAFLDSVAQRPFKEVVASLIRDRVLHRHLWVALRKLRYQGEYTFLVETDEGRVRLRRKDGPVQTTPRLDTSIDFLKDIHLLDSKSITDLGRRLIQ